MTSSDAYLSDTAADGDGTRIGATAAARKAPVDPDWYRVRYPDVAAAGADPAAHYAAHGRAEGRHPTPAAELAALGEAVDAPWYRARYPDVAATGVDPARHYLLDGRAEGRYPNADAEPRSMWDTRFDPEWYRARNLDLGPYREDPLEHFRRVGLVEGRAANAAEEDRDAWRGTLDRDWYLARNPDVAQRGLDPLEHFIMEGLLDRRRPNAGVVLPSQAVTAAPIARLKGDAFTAEVALFVTYAPDGVIKPHVEHHVACLRRCGIACALIVACDRLDVGVTGPAAQIADHVFQRANAGFDFAAWAHVLRLHPTLMCADILYLINDSVFGPTSLDALARIIDRVRASEVDLVGLTDNADRGWHVQSYFLALKKRFLAAEAARDFFKAIVSYNYKHDVVNEYETQLARYALHAGFRIEVLFPTPDWLDATLHNWRRLLRAGFPYLKVGTIRGLNPNVKTADWRTEMASRGYETRLADRTLEQLALGAYGGTPHSRVSTSLSASKFASICRAEMHGFLAEGGMIEFPPVVDPVVSVLVILDGRPERLLRFLHALSDEDRGRMEVVIVDNASADDTYEVLRHIKGATIITNVAPLSLERATCRAFARSRAEVVVILSFDECDLCHAGATSLGVASICGPASFDASSEIAEVLSSVSAAGSGPTYERCEDSDDVTGCAFAVIHRGCRLGTAHAMLRREASVVLDMHMHSDEAISGESYVL